MNVKDIRRENARMLSQSAGGISAFAEKLGKAQSQISHMIGQNPLKNIGDNVAAEIEKAFKKPKGWLDVPHFPDDKVNYGFLKTRFDNLPPFIPILDYKTAANPKQCADRTAPPGLELARFEFVILDGKIADKISEYTFAVLVKDNSMSPDIRENALVVIDPEQAPNPGGMVAAKLERDEEIVLRKYRPRGNDKKHPLFELVPLNPDWPTVTVDSNQRGALVGKIIEVRQYY